MYLTVELLPNIDFKKFLFLDNYNLKIKSMDFEKKFSNANLES